MPTEFVVTSPASSGLGAFRAHYASVEAALRVANMVIDEGSSLVSIVDGDGNTILREDQIKLRNRLVAQNNEARDYLLVQLEKFETGVYHIDASASEGQDNDVNQRWIRQLKIWIAEKDSLLADLNHLVGGFSPESFRNGHGG